MLIGDNNFNKKTINKVFDYFENYQILLIANIGSLEMGTYRYNSDYDIGVLIKDGADPAFKKFTFENYEISLINLHWMLNGAFNQSDDFEFASWNECVQLLMSTHTYDPYGIQRPLFQCFSLNLDKKAIAKRYLDKVLDLYNFQNYGDCVNVKRCLTLLYYLLCLNWVMEIGNYPPISIEVLKQIVVQCDILELINYIQKENEKWNREMLQDKSNITHYSYKLIKLKQKHLSILDHVIQNLKTIYSNINETTQDIVSIDVALKLIEAKMNRNIEIQKFTYHPMCE